MVVSTQEPTGREIFFDEDEIIVSKTDTKGRITYCNQLFQQIAGYTEVELLGESHNCIRHPDMPRCVFQLLWNVIGSGEELFAYVVNMTKNGDHYWVYAHVTPTFDSNGTITGYHSNRRVPSRAAIRKIVPLYAELVGIERSFHGRREGIEASTGALLEKLAIDDLTYDRFVWSLADSEG